MQTIISLVRQFQSTRPRGARQFRDNILKGENMFQSTRPRGARRHNPRDTCNRGRFQSTRPRGARHNLSEIQRSEISVSIHAPARGATSFNAPSCTCCDCFNPRAREGRDLNSNMSMIISHHVSIHAPARGATFRRN